MCIVGQNITSRSDFLQNIDNLFSIVYGEPFGLLSEYSPVHWKWLSIQQDCEIQKFHDDFIQIYETYCVEKDELYSMDEDNKISNDDFEDQKESIFLNCIEKIDQLFLTRNMVEI